KILQSEGRFDEAIAMRKQAADLSPASQPVLTFVGASFFVARRYDEAIVALRRSLAFDPSFALDHMFLAAVYAQKGMYAQALAEGDRCGNAYWCYARATGHTSGLAGQEGRALA